jgi:hypothetical protein
MQVKQQCGGGCQGFLEKYYPERSGGVEIFITACLALASMFFPHLQLVLVTI